MGDRDTGPAAGGAGDGAGGAYSRVRVARVVRETEEARSFVLELPDELRKAFAYRAGQFLTFRVEIGGETLVRCYSLASSPNTDAEHKVTIKRVPDGRVSNWLNDSVRAGHVLEVMRPAGIFTLRDRAQPVVLFSGGSGITPVISLIKSALATSERPVALLYANRSQRSIIFREELDELAARYASRLRVVHRLDDIAGYVDPAAVRAFVGADRDADFYLCGPAPFMELVEGALGELGVDRGRIFVERFESSGAAESADALAPGEALPETLTIDLGGGTHRLAYRAGDTILQTVRDAGLDAPFQCEKGFCSCCKARLRDGAVRMKSNNCLDERAVAAGWVLTCQGIPTAPVCRVEYPEPPVPDGGTRAE